MFTERYPFIPDLALCLVGVYFLVMPLYPASPASRPATRRSDEADARQRRPRDLAGPFSILPLPAGTKKEAPVVRVVRQGQVHVYEFEGETFVAPAALAAALGRLAASRPGADVRVEAAPDVTRGAVTDLWKLCREQGLKPFIWLPEKRP